MIPTAMGLLVCFFAANDNNVEWGGISHVAWQDRRPLCPVDQEPFSVLIQAYRNDLTAVNVVFDDGATTQTIGAYFSHDRGSYAIWRADLPASATTAAWYYFELIDGGDTDYYSAIGMTDAPPNPATDAFQIDFVNLTHAPLGATPVTGGGTVFKVWAPTANNCVVTGTFSGWGSTVAQGATGMTADGDYFVGRAAAANPGDQYKYVFRPGPVWNSDARARRLNPTDNYNSFIEDPFGYVWASPEFTPPAPADMIIYQLHVGTFSGRNDPVASGAIPGTYRDVAAHVDHFVELGVNVVYCMPFTEFPTDFSAGYNPVSNWAPEWAYGTPDDLKYMVDVLHENGIAVLLDIVWNHFSPTDNYLWNYDGGQIYFKTPDVQTWWGSQADFSRPEVRAYYLDSALNWLEEYRLDGFRMDATEFMDNAQPGPPQGADGWSLMQELNDLVDQRFVDRYVLAEQLPDDSWVTKSTAAGGAGFDSQLYDYFVDTLRQEILDAALGDPEMWKIADILDGGGVDLEKTKVVNYIESHDEAWPESGGTRLVKLIDTTAPHNDEYAKGRVKLGYGCVYFGQGIPMILQGSEWLDPTDFGGGDSSGANRINWNLKDRNANIFRWFRDMAKVKKSNGALRADAGINVYHVNETGNVVAWHRWDGSGNDIVVIANFSNTDYGSYNVGLPLAGTWYELLNSDDPWYDGAGLVNGSVQANLPGADGQPQSANLAVARMGLIVLRANDPPVPEPCTSDFNGDGFVDLSDLAILLSNFDMTGATNADGDANGDGVVDLADLALTLADFDLLCP